MYKHNIACEEVARLKFIDILFVKVALYYSLILHPIRLQRSYIVGLQPNERSQLEITCQTLLIFRPLRTSLYHHRYIHIYFLVLYSNN